MKNIAYTIALLGMLLIATTALGQGPSPLAKRVAEVKTFRQSGNLLAPRGETVRRATISQLVRDAQYLDYNKEVAQQLLGSHSEGLSMTLPSVGRSRQNMTLDLVEVSASFYDYVVTTSSGDRYHGDPSKGRHYRGVVRGRENESLVALSLFEGEMMGVVSIDWGNLNIGKLQGEDTHILYNDKDLIDPPSFTCDTPDDPSLPSYDREMLLGSHRSATSTSGKCARLYYETEYDIYQDKGSVANVESYIMGLHNQVATLYANEQIETRVSELRVWDTADPYTATNTASLLSQFQSQTSSLNGDLGQLLTFRSVGGGRAYVGTLCFSNPSYRIGVSGIAPSFENFPTYSWSVMVVTHEFGHLFGSQHTHACVWNGDNTAIDGCAGSTEGSCDVPGYPPEGGTIMSYCHQRSVGINFSEGFGPQPGNVIRDRVTNGSCLGNCGNPCPDDLTITEYVSAGSTDIQQAGSTLTATNTIAANASATYSAGTYVVLSPGFHAKQGSTFLGYIEACGAAGTTSSAITDPIVAVEDTSPRDAVETLAGMAKAVPQSLTVFPNPTSGRVTIDLGNEIAGGDLSVSLYDLLGNELYRTAQDAKGQERIIDLSGHPTGIYLLRIEGGGQSITKKIVKN